MKLVWLLLVASLSWGQNPFNPITATRVLRGTGAPSAGLCSAAADRGKVYIRSDAAAASSSFYACVNTTGTTTAWEIEGAAATTPASPANSIQFNNAGAFGGSANLTWNGTLLSLSGSGTPGNTISHFGPGAVGNNTFEFFATNDFLVNSAGMFLRSANNDANAGSATGFISFLDNSNPTSAMGTIRAGLFSVQHDGAGTLDNAYAIETAFSTDGTPGVITNAYALNVRDVALAVNNWAIKSGLGKVELGDTLQLDRDVANQFVQGKVTAGAAAPGAGFCNLVWRAGTGAGTGKIVAYCGTSTTGVTIADNVGAAF